VATKIGARSTVRFAFVLYIVSALVVMTIGWHGVVASIAVVPYLVIIAPYLNITDQDCERANGGWKRFIWLNFAAGALISLVVINYFQAN
jgi:4-hydroxybenzoate polyprenyltransferase